MRLFLIMMMMVLNFISFSWADEDQVAGGKCLKIVWEGKDSQIEVGSHFVGAEFHKSAIRPNRISFFYPVGNSIDISRDYWKRGDYPILQLGLKVGAKAKKVFGVRPFSYELTPYSVHFSRKDSEKTVRVSYEFCKNKSAMVLKIHLTNNSQKLENFEFYTQLVTSIKTSHTYALQDSARTSYEQSTVYVHHPGKDTADTVIYVSNAGTLPQSFTTNAATLKNWWQEQDYQLPGETIRDRKGGASIAAFIYQKSLLPQETLTIVQIIGAAKWGEQKETVAYLQKHFQTEINLLQAELLARIAKQATIVSGDSDLDHTAKWAKLMIASLDHYLDDNFVPMPCPAQYNFFFTHDVLVTDLAMVNFDLPRVKRDLEFIAGHASKQGIIPHAYYWKDGKYVTELTGDDGWNHFWFVLVTARYYRHSGDLGTLKELYPLLVKSVERFLTNEREGLIHAYRPDWWDIGTSFGPKSYMTILAIRSLQEFVYVSTVLARYEQNAKYQKIALEMRQQLHQKLWDEKLQYLVNINANGQKDSHYYTGSLLAAHFDLLEKEKRIALLNTAKRMLVDEKVGIYNAYPMDFHKLIDYFKFQGNEQGAPFYYMNGGVWYQGNAWYALGLIAVNKQEEALTFIKNTMTLHGIMNGPNGQPALYECRNADKNDPLAYGKVDKPLFLWAGGWYLYTLHHILGLRENVWNISLAPYLVASRARYTVFIDSRPVMVKIHGHHENITSVAFDGKKSFSTVIPIRDFPEKSIEIELGKQEFPCIYSTEAMLISSEYTGNPKKGELTLHLRAFPQHKNRTKITASRIPRMVKLNNTILNKDNWKATPNNAIYDLEIIFSHQSYQDSLTVIFGEK